MLQAVLLAILIFLLMVIIVEKFTELEKKEKLFVYGFILLLIIAIVVYQINNNELEKRNREVILAFEQGKIIECAKKEITKKDFNFVSGTYTFVAKESSPYVGVIYKVEECKIKE